MRREIVVVMVYFVCGVVGGELHFVGGKVG